MSYHVSGVIEGAAPILFNRPYTEPPGTKTEAKRKETAARERVYKNGHGIYIPAWTFKKMLCVDSVSKAGLKIKTSSLTGFLLPALWMDDDPLFSRRVAGKDAYEPATEADFLHEVWGRVPPKKGAMVKIWRPALDTGWRMSFGFRIDDELVQSDQVFEALTVGGLKVGLGGWRPEYGRFVVREWTIG